MGLMGLWSFGIFSKIIQLYFCEIFELQSLENTQKINKWFSYEIKPLEVGNTRIFISAFRRDRRWPHWNQWLTQEITLNIQKRTSATVSTFLERAVKFFHMTYQKLLLVYRMHLTTELLVTGCYFTQK
jgi:hypothetical protein